MRFNLRKRQLGFVEWLPLIGTVASALFAKDSADEAREAQVDTNTQNVALARENRDWQERMSNTAHQREVSDLVSAGLNPILSANKGGATTPGGNVAIVQNPVSHGYSSGSEVAKAAGDLYGHYERGRDSYTERKAKEQNMAIKAPLETLSAAAGTGIEAVKSGVKGAIEAMFEKLSDAGATPVQSTLGKFAESVSSSTAAAVEKVQEVAKEFGVRADAVLSAPEKFISGVTNSAKNVMDNARGPVGRFEGKPSAIFNEIMQIQPASKRAEVLRAFRRWQGERR